jgi:hypothetical protein
VGVPIVTRKDEMGQQGRILVIDLKKGTHEFIKVPMFYDFYQVDFPNKPDIKSKFHSLDVYEAPDIKTAREFYADYKVRNIYKKSVVREQTEEVEEGSGTNLTIEQRFQNFYKERGIKTSIQEKIAKVM